MRFLPFFLFTFSFSLFAQAWTPLDSVHINSGDPKFPFPQFLPYQNGALGNLATHSGVGVTHAEMEQTIRDAYRIAMNRASKPGGGVGDISYVYFNSDCHCTEGDGYAMLAAVALADKTTFDGLWLYVHDKFMHNVKRYGDCQINGPDYLYGNLPGVYHNITDNSAADGDVDIGFALLCAYYQWGEFMGINDACGNPISYKKEALAYLKAFTDTIPYYLNSGATYISGDIGMDGYIKGGDTWTELTNWASNTARSGFLKPPNFGGPQTEYIDYAAPSYYHEFAGFLSQQGNQSLYSWNISQFQRCEASSDWLMGKLFAQNSSTIPFAGNVSLSNDTAVTFGNVMTAEDMRLAWRTILNYLWHGNPTAIWDPLAHQVKAGTANTSERDFAQRYAKFLWDTRRSPWNNSCVTVSNVPYQFWGPSVLWTDWTLNGTGGNFFWLNWIQGTGSPSAVISQDSSLMAEMYRQCETIWDAPTSGDGYLTSIPTYFHEWFRLLGLLVLSGNYQPPSIFQPTANMKVYMAIDKTFGFQNDSVTYTIDYRNYGSQDASGVIIIDTLPKDFIFLSATGGGTCNNATNIVTWNIGAVSGFKTTTGIKPTTGEVFLKIKVGNPTQTQYRNRATISCTNINGSGWTSNEYPNHITSVMERNFLDIAKRALIVKNSVSIPNPKSGTTVQFTINFKNTSDAGWINGGRPGVHFSFSQTTGTANPGIANMNTMRFRLFHDADEAYIDFGNYRVSYFLYDSINTCVQGVNGCTTGWQKTQTIAKGINDPTTVKLLQEMITPGHDSLGRWNQRIVVQFSDPTNPNRVINLAAPDALLEQYLGNTGTNIHRGGNQPLWLVWYINSSSWQNVNWSTSWSWDAKAADPAGDNGWFYPVTNDWTDPNDTNIVVNTWNPKSCSQATHVINNILVEEWDGYTWRRVAGNGPMPGRDVDSVIIRDTVPPGLTLNSASVTTPTGFTKTISGNVITWTKPVMQVNDSGTITFSAVASSSCPLPTKPLVNRAWISGLNESPVTDSGAKVTLACSTAIKFTKSQLWLTDPTNKIIPSGDTAHIDSTVFNIMVVDTDRNVNNNVRDTITVLVSNPSSGDSLLVNLIETGNASDTFRSASPITVASLHGPNQISTSGGETVYILYTDLYDPIDTSSAKLGTLSTFPTPVYGWILDGSGDGRADSAVVVYSKALTGPPDSLVFYFPNQTDSQTVKTGQGTMQPSGNLLYVKFAQPFAAATTSFTSGGQGSGFSYLTNGGAVRRIQFPVADSIGPIITAAQVVERAGGATIDTLYVTFSEALKPASLKGASLVLVKNGTPAVISIDSAKTLTSTRFVLACAAGTQQPLPGDSLRINPAGPLRDLYGNAAHPLNPAAVITLKQIPPTITKAYYVDRGAGGAADGYVDTAIIQFNKKVSLADLSFQLDWGTGLNVANIAGDTISYAWPDSMRVGIALRTVFPYTGLLKTSGDMFVTVRFNSFPGESEQAKVADSAAPVIDSATYSVNPAAQASCDTLKVVFSEPVNISQALNPFVLSGKTSTYTFSFSSTAVTGAIATFCVSPAGTKGLPQNGDTMWIAANNSVSDAGAVFQDNPNNRKVLLRVSRPRSNWRPSIACNPFTPGFTCSAAGGGVSGTVITINPDPLSLMLPPMTLRLKIFDVLGNCVFESQSAQKGADGNSYYFVWDGRNKNSRWVGSGVYRAVVTAIDETGTSSKSRTIGVKR